MIHEKIETIRAFYNTSNTLSLSFRKEQLIKLKNGIHKYEDKIFKALYEDLHKSEQEAYLTEIAPLYMEIDYMLKHMDDFSKPKSHMELGVKVTSYPKPLGVILIIAPWNYPFNLCFMPLIDAISAGNCCIIKPSELGCASAKVIHEMIDDIFSDSYVTCFEGDKEVVSELLEERYDHIVYTGNEKVARIVLEKAAKFLTPCTLELGGKSPALIDESASLKEASKRIAFGKCLNAGQTCIAPDYVLVHETQKDAFIKLLADDITQMYDDTLTCDYYPKIINERHFNRLLNLMDKANIVFGGNYDETTFTITPTIIDQVNENDPIMQEEIFGPLLPIITYSSFDEAVKFIKKRERPLALYLFTKTKENEAKVLEELTFGGGCINDTIMHNATHNAFGGIGNSGMGKYHGESGFINFTHYETILHSSKLLNIPGRYAPFTKAKLGLLKKFVK